MRVSWIWLAAMACGDGAAGLGDPSDGSSLGSTDGLGDDDDGVGDDDDGVGDDDDETGTDVLPEVCTKGAHEQHYTYETSFEGKNRDAIVDLPSDYDGTELRPLVLNFHGLATTAQNQKSYTGMAPAANSRGWIVVHPNGTNRSWDWLTESQDIRFVDALIDDLSADLCIDPKRIYLTGLSNGGYFSYQFACDRGDRIAAIAPVAGAQTAPFCNPGVKIPLLHIHGDDDGTVPYEGSLISPSARASVSGWARDVNECNTSPEVTVVIGDVECETWSCAASDSASLCTVHGGGHTWPGAVPVPFLGDTNQDIDATEEILNFFSQWARP